MSTDIKYNRDEHQSEPRSTHEKNDDRAGCVVFVGNVPFNAHWQELKDHFKSAGNVRFADFIADRDGRPKGSALVTMETPDDAQNAIRKLDGVRFDNRILSVREMHEGPKPSVVKEGFDNFKRNRPFPQGSNEDDRTGCVVHVSNIPFNARWQDLKDHFRSVGAVRFADFIADADGQPKGSALVTMTSPADARKAIRQLNSVLFGGRPLMIREVNDRVKPNFVKEQPKHNYYYNKPTSGNSQRYTAESNENQGENAMSAGDNVLGNNANRGFYTSYSNAAKPNEINNASIRTAVSVPAPRSRMVSENGRRLYVSNLPLKCTSDTLHLTFSQVGNVERADIIMINGRPKGTGVVVMSTPQEANQCISDFDGIEMGGRAMAIVLDRDIDEDDVNTASANNNYY